MTEKSEFFRFIEAEAKRIADTNRQPIETDSPEMYGEHVKPWTEMTERERYDAFTIREIRSRQLKK